MVRHGFRIITWQNAYWEVTPYLAPGDTPSSFVGLSLENIHQHTVCNVKTDICAIYNYLPHWLKLSVQPWSKKRIITIHFIWNIFYKMVLLVPFEVSRKGSGLVCVFEVSILNQFLWFFDCIWNWFDSVVFFFLILLVQSFVTQ